MAETTEITKKPFWTSKTLWVNFLVGVLAVAMPDQLGAVFTADNVAMLIAVVNMVLRAVTKDGVTIS